MGFEPLPNVRDGVVVERLVETLRYVADMRRCEHVVQCPEGVRRRQRLNIEYVDRRAGDLLVLQHIDQSLFVDDRSARRIDQPSRWLHSLQFRSPYQAARAAAQHQMERQEVGLFEELILGKPVLRQRLWRPRSSCSGSRQSNSFQKRSQSSRPVIQSDQVPEQPRSFHGDPCPLFAASHPIGRSCFPSQYVARRPSSAPR